LNLGNPKMPLFYVALLPNVVGTALSLAQVGALAAVILVVEALVIGGHVVLAVRARGLLRDPRMVRRVNRTAGAVMVGAGVTVLSAR
jgi:threonine/homoserine/homoserine lactone efflux protein